MVDGGRLANGVKALRWAARPPIPSLPLPLVQPATPPATTMSAPAAPAAPKAAKAKAPAKPKTHPSYEVMVGAAIAALKERSGSSVQVGV